MLKRKKAADEPGKTKRFKFVTFAEKIANVEIDIFRSANYRLRAHEANEKGNESVFSYFSEELRRLKESASMDVDAEWSALEADLFKLTSTLPLLLKHQRTATDRLLSTLQRNPSSISLSKGIHRLIMIMARDLRHEFYLVSFPKTLRVLVRSVEKPTGSNTSASRTGKFVEAELLESVFTTLAYLFKYLLRSLLENLPGVFRAFAPLLSSKRQYVRMFAAESFAYLVRQVAEKKARRTLGKLFKEIDAVYEAYWPKEGAMEVVEGGNMDEKSDEEGQEVTRTRKDQARLEAFTHGLCQTFFHSVKGLKKRFHSNFTTILPAVLALSTDTSLSSELVRYRRHVIAQLVQDLTRWANPDAAQVLFGILVKHAKGLLDGKSTAALITALDSLRTFLTTLIRSTAITTASVVELLVAVPLAEADVALWSAWFAAFLALLRRDIALSVALVSTLSSSKSQNTSVARLWELIQRCPSLTLFSRVARDLSLALPVSGRSAFVNAALKWIDERLTSENVLTLGAPLADLLASTRASPLPSSCALNHIHNASENNVEGFSSDEKAVLALPVAPLISLESAPRLLSELERLLFTNKEIDASSFYTTLLIASRVTLPFLSKRVYELVDRACASISDDRICSFVIAALLEVVLLHGEHKEINMKLFSHLQHRISTNPSLLRSACRLLDASEFSAKELNSLFKGDFIAALIENLAGSSSQLRDASLSLLRAYAVGDAESENKDAQRPPARSLIDLCLAIERSSIQAPLSDLLPGRVGKLREVLAFRQQRGALSPNDLFLVLNYAQGVFSIRYRPAWIEAQRTLELIASLNLALFWEHTESTWAELITKPVFSADDSDTIALDIDATKDQIDENVSDEPASPLPPVRSLHSSALSSLELPSSRFETAITTQLRERSATPLLSRQSSLWTTFIAVARQVEANLAALVPRLMSLMRLCGGRRLQSGHNDELVELSGLSEDDEGEEDAMEEGETPVDEKEAPADITAQNSEAERHRRVAMMLLEQGVRFVMALARPYQLPEAAQLYELLRDCLSLDTPHVPHLALEAMLKWKGAKNAASDADVIARYSAPLLALADEDTARTTMMQWNVTGDEGGNLIGSPSAPNEEAAYPAVPEEDRTAVADVIVRLVAPRLTSRRHTHGRRGGHKAHVMHQNAILDFLSRLSPRDIDVFLSYLTTPVKHVMESKELRAGVLYGFLQLQHTVIGRLSPVISHKSLAEVINLTISIASSAKTDTMSELNSFWATKLTKSDRSQLSRIRHLAIQRLSEIISRFPNFDISDEKWSEMTAVIEAEVVAVKDSESALLSLATLRWLTVVTSTRSLAFNMIGERGESLIGTTMRLVSRPASALGSRGPQSNDLLLTLVENLLRLRLEPEEGEEALDLIAPHLTSLLSALQARLFAPAAVTHEAPNKPMSNRTKSQHVRSLNHESSLRQLRLLSALSQLAEELSSAQANQLLQLLLPLLRQKTLAEASRTLLFSIFGHVLPFSTAPASHLPFLSQLFSTLNTRQSRTALCEIVTRLAGLDPSLKKVAELVSSLNAYSTKVMDEYDYERRLDGFNIFLSALKENDRALIAPALLAPLIYNFFFFLADTDLSIRSQSAHCLAQLIKYMADAPDRLPRSLLTQLIVPTLKKLLAANTEARTEAISLFGRLVALFPAQFPDLQVLVGKEDDSNFFVNVVHLQVHRRVRAYQKLAQIIQSGALTSKSITQIIIPLAWQCVVSVVNDDQGLAEAAMLVLQATAGVSPWKDYERLLLQVIRALPKYADLEKRLLRLAQLLSEKIVVYNSPDHDEGNAIEVVGDVDEGEENVEKDEENEDDNTGEQIVAEKQSDVVQSVRSLMIPRVQSWLSSRKDTPALAMATAAVLVQLLRALPASHLAKHLPPLLGEICELLVSRVQIVRNTARECLVNVCMTLGAAATLAPILHELERRLARGFQLHVLGYTLHILLLNVAPVIKEASPQSPDALALNEAVPLLMKLFLRDYLELSEQKSEDRTIKMMKEGKRSRAPQALEILTGAVSVDSLSEIIRPVAHVLVISYNPGRVNKLVTLLHHIQIGAVKNSALTLIDTLPYLCSLIQANLPKALSTVSEPTAIVKARDAKKERLIVKGAERRDRGRLGVDPAEQHSHPENLPAKKTGGLKRSLNAAERTLSVLRGEKGEKEYERSARRGGESDEEDEEDEENEEEEEPEPSDSSNHHHVVTWALSFIQARLKAQRNSPWTEDTTKAFAPLLPLLNICLSQRHSGPAMMTLKVYVALLGVPHFTTLQQSGSVSSVTRSTFKLLKSSGTTSSLGEQCLRVLSTIIRDHSAHAKLSESKLRFLLDYLTSHLIEGGSVAPVVGRRWTDKDTAAHKGEAQSERTTMALTLLKAIVNAKIVLPGVYDVMKHLLPLIVHTEAGSVRALASSILVQFMLTYPLGSKRIQQTIDTIVANLQFEQPRGRLSVLEIMQTLTQRLPSEFLSPRAASFYLPLVLVLVNDDDRECRVKAASTLQQLCKSITNEALVPLIDLTFTWAEGGENVANERVTAGVHVLSLLVEAVPEVLLKRLTRLFAIVRASIDYETKQLEEVATAAELSSLAEAETDVMPPYPWQRTYYSLLLLEKLVALRPSLFESDWFAENVWSHAVGPLMLHPHIWVRSALDRLLGRYFGYCSDRAPFSAQSDPTAKTALWLGQSGVAFELIAKLCQQLQSRVLDEVLAEQIVKNLVFLSMQMLRLPQLTPSEAIARSNEDVAEDEREAEATQNNGERAPLHWLVRRLSFMARKAAAKNHIRTRSVLQYFGVLGTQVLSGEVLAEFLVPMLHPIYRISIMEAGFKQDLLQQNISLASELIRSKIAQNVFFAAYEEVRMDVNKRRLKRRREAAEEAVANPELHARKKLKHNQLKVQSRKRKNQFYSVNKTPLKVAKTSD